jgi:hypothetical protein
MNVKTKSWFKGLATGIIIAVLSSGITVFASVGRKYSQPITTIYVSSWMAS